RADCRLHEFALDLSASPPPRATQASLRSLRKLGCAERWGGVRGGGDASSVCDSRLSEHPAGPKRLILDRHEPGGGQQPERMGGPLTIRNLRATTAAAFCASRVMPTARYSSVRRANASSMCSDDGDCLSTNLRRLIAPVWSPRLA